MATITDPEGGQTAFTYTAKGQVASQTSPRDTTTTYTYDAAGNRVAELSPEGNTTTFGYDATGRMVSRTGPRGNVSGADPEMFTTHFVYDDGDLLVAETDPFDHTTTHVYDEVGDRVATTDRTGHTTTYAYDAAHRLVETTDALGRAATRAYDGVGNLVSQTNARGDTTTYTYDAANRVDAMVTARGNAEGADPAQFRWDYAYDDAGNRTHVTDPLGHTTQTSYDDLNRPVQVVDPVGNTTLTDYDPNGNITAVTNGEGETTTYTYDANNRLIRTTDGEGRITDTAYTPDGLVAAETVAPGTPAEGVTTYSYDGDGRRISMVDPRGNVPGADPAQYTWVYGYDPAGNQTTVTDPLGNTTVTDYDATNRTRRVVDPSGRATATAYDPEGRITAVTAPDGGTTAYGYDQVGDRISRTDAHGHTTTYAYNPAHQLVSETDPLGRVTEHAYDPEGQLVSTTTARGIIERAYNPRGEPVGIDYTITDPEVHPTPDVSIGYDPAGRITSRTNGIAETFGYDNAGRLTTYTRQGATFTYTYDNAGLTTGRVYGDGTAIAHAYDPAGRQTSLTSGGQTFGFGHDPAGNLTTTTHPNAHTETRGIDPAGRLTDITTTNTTTGTVLSGYDLTLDGAGRPTHIQVTRTGLGTGGFDYTYDPAGRLASACVPDPDIAGCPEGGQVAFTYDQVGNRTTRTHAGATTTYTHDEAEQLTQTTTTNPDGTTSTALYIHDTAGNLINNNGHQYYYDLQNRLTRAGGIGYSAFGYDAAGLLAWTSKGRTIDYRHHYDPANPLPLLAYNSDDTGTRTGATHLYDPAGQPIAYTAIFGDTVHTHHDWLVSIADTTNTTGDHLHRFTYTPYGQRQATKLTPYDYRLPHHGYTGQHHNTRAQTLYLRARWHHPALGQLLTQDPATPNPTHPYLSPYLYADQQPTYLTDHSGLCAGPAAVICAAAVRALVAAFVGVSAYQLGQNVLENPITLPDVSLWSISEPERLDPDVRAQIPSALAGEFCVGLPPVWLSPPYGPPSYDPNAAGVLRLDPLIVYANVDDFKEAIDSQKEHLKPEDLEGAWRESRGETVSTKSGGDPHDHVKEVRDAQKGLINTIQRLKRKIGYEQAFGRDPEPYERLLGEASRLLDHSRKYLPR